MLKNKTADEYISQHPDWLAELQVLRNILLDTELVETIKWGAPVYTLDNKNVVGLAAFKQYVGLWFFQGVFLDDSDAVLVNAQSGKTKAMRQWRFQSIDEMNRSRIKAYLDAAILNQHQGKIIRPDYDKPIVVPPELQQAFANSQSLQLAFDELTPGRQREYVEYIVTAKREVTKYKRLEKIAPMIVQGIGLNDKYRNC